MNEDLPQDLKDLLAEHRRNTRYFLAPAILDPIWQEVTESDFASAERGAGFHPKPGCGPVATGAFSSGSLRGRTISLPEHMPTLGQYVDLEGVLHPAVD